MPIDTNGPHFVENYRYKTKPYAHQHRIFTHSRDRRYVGLFAEMGTGKTKICIDTIAHLWKTKQITGALIIAPKGVYRNWHTKEVPAHMPDDVPLYEFVWSPTLDRHMKSQFENLYMSRNDDKLRIIYMNVEALSTEKGGHFAMTFCKYTKSVMAIVDESTTIKSSAAKRTKVAIEATKNVAFRRIASGLPTPQSPVDMFSQLKFLDPYCLPTQSFFAFRNRYCVMREVRLGPRRFNKIVGFKNMDELHAIMERVGYRVLKKDCLDLPEKTYQIREVDLSDQQRDAYEALVRDTMMQINDERMRGVVTAPLMITRLVKLHQVACGHLVMDGGDILDFSTPRLTALDEVLDDMEPPVLIWATYRHDIRRIVDLLSKKYGPQKVAHFYGDSSSKEREDALTGFYEGRVSYFVGNPAVGGYGLSLVRSHNVIYYSNSYNLEHRLQSEDRVHRIGQTLPVTYIDLVARGTVDEKILTALRNKETLARALLDQGAEFFR